MFQILLLTGSLLLDTGLFKPLVIMDEVSDDSEFFLSLPQDVAIDSSGRYLVADAMAKTVFVWDRNGKFVGHFGKPGQGPGEFQFMGMGGPQAYLGTVGDQILVYDGSKRSVGLFGKSLEFEKSTLFQIPGGRTNYFKPTPEGNYLVYQSTWGENPKRSVTLFDASGKKIRDINSTEDKSYKLEGSGNRPSAVVIQAFSPVVVVNYQQAAGRVIVGDSARPSFEIYNLQGELEKKVEFKMAQRDVTAEDKAEFNEMPWIKNSSFMKADFPDKMAYYNTILPVKGDRFLVVNISPHFRNMVGLLISGNGNILKRVNFPCGENGAMFSIDGRIIAITTDEYGEFQIQELDIVS